MSPRVLVVLTYYPGFLDDLYRDERALAQLSYRDQLARILAAGFSAGDAYSDGLRRLGCDATEVIVNADVLQARWADENGFEPPSDSLHEQRRQIVFEQVRAFQPDVVYVFEWCPLGDAFLARLKDEVPLVVGELSSALHPNRTYAGYDLITSSWPPIVEHFRSAGMAADHLRLGFDGRVLRWLEKNPPVYDVSFVGGLSAVHVDRIAWLERIAEELDVAIFGYGIERTREDSPIRRCHRGPAWGRRMYEILQQSRVTLNAHGAIDVRGRAATNIANNLRLYEATGVEACLVTDWKDNLPELFSPGVEVVSYRTVEECIEKVRYYLTHEEERARIAAAGQARTLRDHTYQRRMEELLPVLTRRFCASAKVISGGPTVSRKT